MLNFLFMTVYQHFNLFFEHFFYYKLFYKKYKGLVDSVDPQVKSNEGHFSRGVAVDSLMHPRVALPPPEGGPECPPPGVDGLVGERCLLALGHVREGLEALRQFPENKEFVSHTCSLLLNFTLHR